MTRENRAYERSTYYIKKEFQFRFIIKFCLILLAGIGLSTGLVFYFSQETLTSRFENSRLVIENTGNAIMPTLIVTNLVTLGIIILVAIGVTLFVSHRIAGPMFRLEQDIREISRGNLLVKVHLRKKDQFVEMAGAVNAMAVNIHGKISRIDRAAGQLADECEDMPGPEVRTAVLELKETIHREFSL